VSTVTVWCNHVALLVADLEQARSRLDGLELPAGPVESFPSEGTRELYLGDPERPGLLLLIQPEGDGPYARALAKRGPGLHHVALDVPDAAAFVQGAGPWLLHPASLTTLPGGRTAWLARPGAGVLIEVQERAGPAPDGPPVIEAVEVPIAGDLLPKAPLAALGACLTRLEPSPDQGAWIRLAGGPRLPADLSG
jgi:catechol 2,3-dioxygenase-like lactoylglutathione lyase family enzyme